MWTLFQRLQRWCVRIGSTILDLLKQLLKPRLRVRRRGFLNQRPTNCRRVFAQPKPNWVRKDIIRLKALMPEAGCRLIAHHFNRRWKPKRQMTVSKTYVADLCRKHHYLIHEARRKLKHRVPRPMRRNRVWGCDLLAKTDTDGRPHLALAILDHASRACLRLRRLSDRSSWTSLQELVQAVKRYGRPQYLRTDHEAVLVSRWFRFGLWWLGIRQQRIQPGCPWRTDESRDSLERSNGN